MREIPFDSNRVTLIGTGKAAARAEYVKSIDPATGKPAVNDKGREIRTRVEGGQERNEAGTPMWVVDVIPDMDDADRAEVIGVKVACPHQPVMPKWQPVRFINLVAVPYVDQGTGRVALSWRADGIDQPGHGAKGKPTDQPAA